VSDRRCCRRISHFYLRRDAGGCPPKRILGGLKRHHV
jgi:hypothetical protein